MAHVDLLANNILSKLLKANPNTNEINEIVQFILPRFAFSFSHGKIFTLYSLFFFFTSITYTEFTQIIIRIKLFFFFGLTITHFRIITRSNFFFRFSTQFTIKKLIPTFFFSKPINWKLKTKIVFTLIRSFIRISFLFLVLCKTKEKNFVQKRKFGWTIKIHTLYWIFCSCYIYLNFLLLFCIRFLLYRNTRKKKTQK